MMKHVQVLIVLVGQLFATATYSSPIKYVMDSTTPSGWFIYDRVADQMMDYSFTFSGSGITTATFTFPSTKILPNFFHDTTSSLVENFGFTDQTNATGNGQNYDVRLGYTLMPEKEVPVRVDFFASPLDGISVGQMYAPISYIGQKVSGTMFFQPRFHIDSTWTWQPPISSSVPAPPVLILVLTGLGLLTLTQRLRKDA
jgi:hypothetical protein